MYSSRSEVHIDDEEKLIEAVKNPINLDMPIQMTKNMSGEAKITLVATLVTDTSKNIIVSVKIGDSLTKLQVIIGENMKTHYPDVFESLDGVRAYNIVMKKDKFRILNEWDIIDEGFQDGDHIFFEIESINFWLRVKFLLYHRNSLLPPIYNEKDDENKLYIEGFTRIRVNKNETVKFLRKQLQLLIIQVWSLLLSDENKYYLLDEFSVVSLFPPAQKTAPENVYARNSGVNDGNSSVNATYSQY